MVKDIYVLSIQEFHNCTAALLKNGKIIAIISEERLTRIKNTGGFPKKSIEWVLNYANITAEDLEVVAICSEKYTEPPLSSEYSPEHKNIRKNSDSIIQKIYGYSEYKSGLLYKPLFKTKEFLYDKKSHKKGVQKVYSRLLDNFNIPKEKVIFVDHHLCHAYSAYYGQTITKEKALVLTLDGEGDDYSATVNIAQGNKIERIAATWRHNSIGYIYSLTTKFMGMTPLEHEYKVMGLAPYAASKEQKYFMKTYEKIFKDIMWLDEKNPLIFKSKFPTNRFQYWLEKRAVGERFDNLAGALQYFTEDLVVKWVKAAIKSTGINNIYCGGGVFMNVKMNMLISEISELKTIHVLPSCGDDSNPIGGAYYAYLKICKDKNITPEIERITDLYLGPSFDTEVEPYIEKNNLREKYIIKKMDPHNIAQMLAKGEIVARCVGRMEWGARSLGNRCIMANPSDLKYVWEINEQIKMRDFWMPFAPTILKERSQDYIYNPKNIEAPYMIMAFRSTELSKKELRAAMHQSDFTVRPQLIERDWNPKYYDIIKEFEKVTGIGGILNTSFNLHGKPIVMTPKDAVEEVFEHSGLQHLILGEYLLSKR